MTTKAKPKTIAPKRKRARPMCAPADYALHVIDESMNRVLPLNSYAMCVIVREDRQSPRHYKPGNLLHVRRFREDGLVNDCILRVARKERGRLRLETQTLKSRRQDLYFYPAPKGWPRIEIVGRVTGRVTNL
jgi:hypothetical protein